MNASVIARSLAAAIALASLAGVSAPASADEVTFVMKNEHTYAVEVELYSQDRDHVWPGNNEVYYLDDGEAKQMPVSCQAGETICYGAWVSGDPGTYWGTGPNNTDYCEDCCYTCEGGETEEIDLVE